MPGTEARPTGAALLVRQLKNYGVSHVFGYPGGQLTPLYDALFREPGIRHVLARAEQAAAFMADGYARATGRPGVCLAVCGPGVYNAATPLATAFTDSVPVLLISGQVPTTGLGLRSGYYHENDQLDACATMTKARYRAGSVAELVPMFGAAWQGLTSRRPGPVLFEVPVDVLRAPVTEPDPLVGTFTELEALLPPPPDDSAGLAKLIAGWRKPVLLAGGGVLSAGAEAELIKVAERLGAPVFTSLMGKSAFPGDHPLVAGLPWYKATSDLTQMEGFFSPLLGEADGMLAIGCRFTQATTGGWALKPPASLVQIDIDKSEIGRHYPVKLGIHADARIALAELLPLLPAAPRSTWAAPPTRPLPWRLPGLDLIGPLRRALPRDAIVVADITRLSYIMLTDFPVYQPRTFLHPAGFVPMGYGLPAALGAKAAFPERCVLTVVGDGCFLMCGMELASAVQEKLPIVVVLINDGSLTLIKAIQQRRYEGRHLGVDLVNPDFGLFAEAFGVRHWRVDTDAAFYAALREAVNRQETVLIEVMLKSS